jgi:hypothetical protein
MGPVLGHVRGAAPATVLVVLKDAMDVPPTTTESTNLLRERYRQTSRLLGLSLHLKPRRLLPWLPTPPLQVLQEVAVFSPARIVVHP